MAVLTRRDATRRKAFAVTDAVDVINNWNFWIAGQQEIGVHRVRRTAGVDGAYRRDESLANHLAAKDPLPADLRRAATEQIHFERFEVENTEQVLDGGRHVKPEMVKVRPQPAMLRPYLQA